MNISNIKKEMNNQSNVETKETKEVFDLENDQYIETPFHIIESYFKGQHLERLVKHQLESYNNFVNFQITKTIEMFNPVHIASEQDFDPNIKKHSLELFVTFENFNIYRPQIYENNGAIKLMFPQEARLRNFTYASAMTVDINIKYVVRTGPNLENVETFYKTLHKIHIGKLPIMLKSNICVLTQYKHVDHNQTGECRFDAGGYFIINGSEKTVLGQERAAENKVFCFNISKNNTKYHWLAEIKSVPDFKCISPKQINMMISSKNNGFGNVIHIQIPRVKQPLPLFIVFRALGAITDKEICEKILLDIENKQKKELLQALQASIMEADKYLTQEDAIKHITSYVMYTPINMDKETGAKKKLEFTMDILKNDLFPHCHNVTEKIYFLGYMANKLLQTSFQIFKTDDRDSYANKRIDLTGTLLNNLFRNYFNKLVKDMEKQVIREINTGSWKSKDDYENIMNQTNIYKIIKSTTIENGIKRALATGDFGIKNTNSNKVGVAQVLNRLTYVSSLSHARRISTPTDKSGKLIPPRKLHNTSWGFVCVTGDTDVLLSNRMDTKKIKEIRDGDWVNTVNRESLMDEPSDMYQSFSKMPDKLFELVTISGRKIKATADHPFLVKKPDGTYQMKKVGELNVKEDKVMIRHTVGPITTVTVNTEIVLLKEEAVQVAKYRLELLERNLLNIAISTDKLKIIARLLGALNTDGHLSTNPLFAASFNLGEEYDVYQVADDIKTLGFGNVSIRRKISKFEDKNKNRTTTTCTWEVCKSGVFAYFMYLMGAIPGKKTESKRVIPVWLVKADLHVKREFLSAFQGGDGSRLSYQKNDKTFKPNLGITMQTTDNDYLNETIQYMTQISNMFQELNILCTVKTKEIPAAVVQGQGKSIVYLVFEKSTENLLRYAETISYTYCEEKRRVSAPIIEHLKIRGFNKLQRDTKYTYIFDNYTKEPIVSLIEKTTLSENQVRKIISKMKKGGKNMVNTRLTTDTIYEDFIRENIADNGCISIGLLSITEIEPELVYDFTTRSENHSFVASSFVVSNCPAETPEGQSVGIVKNLSYMTHITIYSNSLPLYEYILPNVKTFEQSTKEELFTNVKVFINGAWVGVTEKPEELYLELKEKKYKGIINVYTSIIFDYRLKEIRVCNDGGRLSRPVLRIKDKNLLITPSIIKKLQSSELVWDDLFTNARIAESVLEYIDPEEQNLSMIATVPKDIIRKTDSDSIYKYTHCEIHPSTIFGVLASCIPFPENNQSPRNCYQCLDINETVLMKDGTVKKISDIQIDEEVVSFHPETKELTSTKVVNHFIIQNQFPVFKLTLINNKSIIATLDHKFMTNLGWLTVEKIINLNFTPLIGIFKDYSSEYSFINILHCEQVSDRLVCDITVESENHSFITSHGIMSSNCAQGKQAMGVYVTNYENRMDKTAYVLNYPTRPLVDTRIMNMIQLNKIPSGTNVIVAIMTHTGYNQEDSLLFNKASVDRGLFVTTVYHTEKDEDKQKINGDEEIRCKPDPLKTKGMKMANYQKVNSKGVIPENTLVANRDIIISKVIPIKENRNDHTKVIKFEDQSKLYRTTEETYIDKNYIDKNGDGYNFAKVRLRTVRKPVIGDKFSSRHGQKGTIGNIIPECDMPFTSAGLKPDIIINPHAIPSRMTIGQLKETLLGKVLVELGLFGDGTSFGKLDINDIRKELLKIGYESNGNELLHNGLTGEQVECSVFMGPVFYQRLKHMVVDKAHSRSIGPMVNLTRQPAEGRSRDGGLRFGEMERDCFQYRVPIPLNCGLSVEIGTMENNDLDVLGYSEKDKGIIVAAKQSAFLCKGERECIEMTLQDGRKIICTPEHRLLKSNGEWTKANDFKVNEEKVKASVNYPLMKVEEEILECNLWSMTVGNIQLSTDNKENFMKTLAFARILGYLMNDGGIYYLKKMKKNVCYISLGHMIDVGVLINDLELFYPVFQENFKVNNFYRIILHSSFVKDLLNIKEIPVGAKIKQPSQLPAFILDSSCPRPIVREFLGGMFGADGHTCVLGMHRGKRDLLSSISFSKTKKQKHLESLTEMFEHLQKLLKKCGIEKTTIQKFKETSSSKKTQTDTNDKSYQLTLHLDIEELVPFSEKIGFRYCCHKSQRLEAGVSYKRLRNEVKRQHDWLTNRVNEITNFMDSKKENPLKIVPTKKALEQAVKELKEKEALVHEYAIPSTHDITDHLIKGTTFGKFTSKSFPTAEEYLREIGALDWFLQDLDYKKNIKEFELEELDLDLDLEEIDNSSRYGVERVKEGLPTMELKVIDIRPAGIHKVYDIQVDDVHSFLANGLVAHNCMISHGASRFTRERMYDVSDKYNVHVCKKCGSIASYNDSMNIHHCKICDNRVDFAYVEIPYACKLLFQELNTMNIAPRIMTKQD
jgi:DNA-directed RNA polymerase beta subunit